MLDLKTWRESADWGWGGMPFHRRTADGEKLFLYVSVLEYGMRTLDSLVGFGVGIRVPSLGFASIRPPAVLYSMMTLLDARLSCRGSKFSVLTKA